MPHLEHEILVPSTKPVPSEVLFDTSKFRPMYRKPLVCMVQKEEAKGAILIPDTVQGKYQADVGVVADPAGVPELSVGDIVLLKPYTGKWMDSRDFAWIPDGREMRQLGTVNDALDDVLAIWM